MIDEERQAAALRARLDQELAGVHVTAEARERLDSRIAPRAAEPTGWDLRRWPTALALPLAAASVVVAVVAVPALVRSDSGTAPPAGGAPLPGPASPTPARSASPTPAPRPTPAQPTEQSTQPKPTSRSAREIAPDESMRADATAVPGQASAIRLRTDPESPATGQRTQLTVVGAPRERGDLTVSWGDGTTDRIPGSCSRQPAVALSPLMHVFTREGRYRVKVELDVCGDTRTAETTIGTLPTPAPSRQ